MGGGSRHVSGWGVGACEWVGNGIGVETEVSNSHGIGVETETVVKRLVSSS